MTREQLIQKCIDVLFRELRNDTYWNGKIGKGEHFLKIYNNCIYIIRHTSLSNRIINKAINENDDFELSNPQIKFFDKDRCYKLYRMLEFEDDESLEKILFMYL